jgi:predicted RNA-binding protein with PUA-like domain
MLIEQGLGISPGRCDRLASDEPEALLTSPTWIFAEGSGLRLPPAADTFAEPTMPAPDTPRQYWLMKSEPDEASIDDLARAEGQTLPWTGVRNYQARNFMRDAMSPGDGVLFYHSSCAQPGIAGLAEVVGGLAPDPTQFDPASPYHDPRSSPQSPRWLQVDVRLVRKTPLLPLARMRACPALSTMRVLQRGNRLSITPVTPSEWQSVLALLDG